MNRKTAKRFLLLHIAAVAAALLFPLYARFADFLSFGLPKCLLHDVFYVYCPLCGGTRAVEALLRLNLTDALRCNALVVAALPFALAFYLRAWRRLLRGESSLWRAPAWVWIAAVSVMVLFGVARNVLMIGFGIDPLGDLWPVWNGSPRACAY